MTECGLFFERETGVAGTKLKSYVWAPTGIVATITSDGGSTWTTQYLHTDHLGSVSVVTDANQGVVDRLAYEPFG